MLISFTFSFRLSGQRVNPLMLTHKVKLTVLLCWICLEEPPGIIQCVSMLFAPAAKVEAASDVLHSRWQLSSSMFTLPETKHNSYNWQSVRT